MKSPVLRPLKIPGKRIVITKRDIEQAIENTRSQSEAARWIGVSYNTHKKYATRYGLWEQHKNPSGKGIKKGWGSYRVSLEDIFNGTNTSTFYTKTRFKKRLIEEGYLYEECSICGWNEPKILDGIICLNLDYIDGNPKNKSSDKTLNPKHHDDLNFLLFLFSVTLLENSNILLLKFSFILFH